MPEFRPCQYCGTPFHAETLRNRYCGSECVRAAEAAHEQRRRKIWSPERRRAGSIVANAIYAGRLSRQPCEVCGHPYTEAHHDDYSQPLAVRWLCRSHHRRRHVMHGGSK